MKESAEARHDRLIKREMRRDLAIADPTGRLIPFRPETDREKNCPGHAGKKYSLDCRPCCMTLLARKTDSNRDVFFRLLEAQKGLGPAWAEEVRKAWEDECGK